MSLNLKPNIDDPDGFYEKLITLQRNLSDDEVLLLNARLVLVLANHIGDARVLEEAMRIASGE